MEDWVMTLIVVILLSIFLILVIWFIRIFLKRDACLKTPTPQCFNDWVCGTTPVVPPVQAGNTNCNNQYTLIQQNCPIGGPTTPNGQRCPFLPAPGQPTTTATGNCGTSWCHPLSSSINPTTTSSISTQVNCPIAAQ
jgi:hypothetical protein